MSDQIERRQIEDLARETPTDRAIDANDQLLYHEVHKMLRGQAERDLVVARMQVTMDKMSCAIGALLLDRDELQQSLTELAGELDTLRRQQAEDRARQNVVAAVLDAWTGQIEKLTERVGDLSEP
jgi:hypothetical protein